MTSGKRLISINAIFFYVKCIILSLKFLCFILMFEIIANHQILCILLVEIQFILTKYIKILIEKIKGSLISVHTKK